MTTRRNTPEKKKNFLLAYEKTAGNFGAAADRISISRRAAELWRVNDPKFAAALDAIDEKMIDWAESKLKKLIESGNVAANIFFLKCKAKRRGYIERQEITGKDGAPVNEPPKYDYSKLTKDEIKTLAEILEKATPTTAAG